MGGLSPGMHRFQGILIKKEGLADDLQAERTSSLLPKQSSGSVQQEQHSPEREGDNYSEDETCAQRFDVTPELIAFDAWKKKTQNGCSDFFHKACFIFTSLMEVKGRSPLHKDVGVSQSRAEDFNQGFHLKLLNISPDVPAWRSRSSTRVLF
jgi:hypothetical protein